MIWNTMLGKKTVRIHLRDNMGSIEGILVSKYGREFKLVGAKWLSSGEGEDTPLDGTAHIPRENVRFFQEIG